MMSVVSHTDEQNKHDRQKQRKRQNGVQVNLRKTDRKCGCETDSQEKRERQTKKRFRENLSKTDRK